MGEEEEKLESGGGRASDLELQKPSRPGTQAQCLQKPKGVRDQRTPHLKRQLTAPCTNQGPMLPNCLSFQDKAEIKILI